MPEPIQDLLLWDVLHDARSAPDALVGALDAVARIDLEGLRGLLLGRAPQLASHPHALVRAAAARALPHAQGDAGALALALLLDDDDVSVRSAAVDACDQHSDRLATLCLFHRRADVRARMVQQGWERLPFHALAHLLADPGTAPLVLQRLDRDAAEPRVANTILAAHTLGLLSAAHARERLQRLPWHEPARVLPALRYGFIISEKEGLQPDTLTNALAREWRRDSLNEIVELCALKDGALDDDAPWCRALLAAFAAGKLPVLEHRRVALALLVKALKLGDAPPRLLALIFASLAGALGMPLPAESKRRALHACTDVIRVEHSGRAKLAALPMELLQVGGQLMPRLVAGAMRLLAAEPYRALEAAEPMRARLLAALHKHPKDAAVLLELPPQSAADKASFDVLVPQVLALELPPRALGTLLLALPQQAKPALDGVEKARPGRAEECLIAVVDALEAHSAPDPLRDERAHRVASAMAAQLSAAALPRLVADVVTRPLRAARPVAAALLRAVGPTQAKGVVQACRPHAEAALVRHLDELALSSRAEGAWAQALSRSKDAAVQAYCVVRLEDKSAPVVLEDLSRDGLRAAPDDAVTDVLREALVHPVRGVAALLLGRLSLPRSAAAAAGALCLDDPPHEVAALFQRLVQEDAGFLVDVDGALRAHGVRADLPLMATAWLHTDARQALRFEYLARHLGLAGLLEIACDVPSPLLAMKLAAAVVAVARGWELQRPPVFERNATTALATLCFSLLVRARRPRPAEAGTSRLDAWPTLRLSAVELLKVGAQVPGAAAFVEEVRESLQKLDPVLEDDIAEALSPLLRVRRAGSAGPALADTAGAAPARPAALRFDDAVTRGDGAEATALALEPTQDHWLTPERLAALSPLVDSRRLSLALATSPHPAAHTRSLYALDALLRADPSDAPALAALRAFLRAGDDRARELRLFAGEALARVGVLEPFLWLRTALVDGTVDDTRSVLRDHGADLTDLDWQRVLSAARAAGGEVNGPLLMVLRNCRLPEALAGALAHHLLGASDLDDEDMRELFSWVRRTRRPDDERMEELRRALQWGILQGRKLLHRSISVELIHDAWGYTKLGAPRVYINPLPILRGVRDGDAVVRGLLVHELGHQLYHADARSKDVWNGAQKRKLQSLLNLVADEHLERRLRSESAVYGDHLKTLCSHAFQHADKDVGLELLLEMLGTRAFAVLSRVRLLPGKRSHTVRVDVGRVIKELAAAGGSFARFVRALRQGLGVRDADEKVKQALALFATRGFRASTMDQLMAITEELQRIFGDEIQLLSAVGMHEVMESDESDVLAEGLSPDELADLGRRPRTGPLRGRPVFNKGSDEAFDVIQRVVVLPHEPNEHRVLALQGKRSSAALRRTFQELGSRVQVEHRRLAGRALDRSGLASAIARRDPRLLVKRTVRPGPDLFVGVAVDCSGSMQRDGCMERGRLFATLIAEAARDLPGIDVRVLGFTDTTLFDAGDQQRCAAHALHADGGNNDAAGLWHGSLLARASRRRARLLVMISDGLPTECTLSSLRALVRRLERQGTCCAQVAVRPLAEHGFRHYVEILDDDVDAAARRFARVISQLVRSTL